MGGENGVSKNQLQHHQHQVVEVPTQGGSKCFDDDGKLKRTGNMWTASAHIITAVIGSGVLSLAWAIAQLGWIAGHIMMLLFSFVIYYTSCLLAECYRTGDPATGKRNYTYMEAVESNLGGLKVKVCGLVQYLNFFGVAIGYTIAASISMMAIKRSNCFHDSGAKNPYHLSSNPYMIIFGAIASMMRAQEVDPTNLEVLLALGVSHTNELEQAAALKYLYRWLQHHPKYGTLAPPDQFDSLYYADVARLFNEAAQISPDDADVHIVLGVLYNLSREYDKAIAAFQTALKLKPRDYSLWNKLGATQANSVQSADAISTYQQDTVKSPPSEAKTMKKATLMSVGHC